jgi:hypothetical protein
MATITIPYRPREVFKPFHGRAQRFAVGVAHRRCGKTVGTVNDMIKRAILSPLPAYMGAYIAPYRNQAKKIAWAYLKQYSRPLWAAKPNETDLFVTLRGNGATLSLYGADNADALRGGYLDDAILDEYADMHPAVWGAVVRPMLADRGGTATFIGTPKGKNDFWRMRQRALMEPEEWFTFMLRASETGILPVKELESAARDMTPEEYAQEFECSFEAAIKGAYFGRELSNAEAEGRLRASLPRIPGLPVHTAWDFGNGANMAIWAFQVTREGEIWLQDFISQPNWYFKDYLQAVNERGYSGTDFVPHDARVPDFTTGRTRIETMIAEDRKPVLVAMHGVDDGINAAKLTLPRCVFSLDRTELGVEALRQYRQEYDEKLRVFRNTPKHDWASHPADAFRYLAMAWRLILTAAPEPPKGVFKPLRSMSMEEFASFDEDHVKPVRV